MNFYNCDVFYTTLPKGSFGLDALDAAHSEYCVTRSFLQQIYQFVHFLERVQLNDQKNKNLRGQFDVILSFEAVKEEIIVFAHWRPFINDVTAV